MRCLLAILLLTLAAATSAQVPLTQDQALAEDAVQYAAQFGVAPEEALRRLKLQQASVAVTDAIAKQFADRLAGISIDNGPEYRIVVLLTGNEAPIDQLYSGIPVVFQAGAKATHAQAVMALRKHLIDLRADLPNQRGAGYDQRTGEIVLLVTPEDAQRFGAEAIRKRAEQVGGVPVRVVLNQLNESNMTLRYAASPGSRPGSAATQDERKPGIVGGGRVEGLNLQTHLRNLCTTAFVVTNGETNAIATAAHCPDELTYVDRDGTTVTLPMIGSWGAAYRDVQLNGSPNSRQPLFYSNRGAGTLRQLVSWRNVASTHAGDFVCHYGESSGYSCSTVELTDYAPPGDLCGGPCSPMWVTVRGPSCVPGDSGGPVFSGEIAFGIAKGVNNTNGRGLFYYYMSTDYLPAPWRPLVVSDVTPRRSRRP